MEKKIFQEFLARKGLKFTKERERILNEISAFHGHFDPEELLISIRRKETKVSKASIYRTLPLLLESGLIEQVEKNDKHAHYEHTFGHRHHDHCICVKCGAIIEVFSPKLEAIQEELCGEVGFTGIRHTLEIRGYCRDCNGEQ
ncbi:MAG TPA: transcriptional repressor [Thermodesulfovibrionales bacterium]|nr:transcriptional repressor [Thermodesulfovibrionales bacterium]